MNHSSRRSPVKRTASSGSPKKPGSIVATKWFRCSLLLVPLAGIIVNVALLNAYYRRENPHLIDRDADAAPVVDSQQAQAHLRSTASSTTFRPQALFQAEYNRIDSENITTKCERYGFQPLGKGQTRRRLFFGSMIADDSLEVVKAHAAEAFNVYHTVALVESNTTHLNTPRAMRFANDTAQGSQLLKSGIFGPNSRVVVEAYLGDAQGTSGMDRERIQREEILKVWKRAGMQPQDVGIMSDMDELFTRDFLRAAQECDVSFFRPDESCKVPKRAAQTLVFESSPECITQKRYWFHPDIIVGHCIEQIGDPTGRIVAKRQGVGGSGVREHGYGGKGPSDYSDAMKKNGSYPLYSGTDIRELGGWPLTMQKKPSKSFSHHTGYHFHNFFDDMHSLRYKYNTYAHFDPAAYTKKLSELHMEDTDVMVRCAKGISVGRAKYKNKEHVHVFDYHKGGLAAFEGLKPIYFLDEGYRKQRHEQLLQVIKEDEAKYGTDYPDEQEKEVPSKKASSSTEIRFEPNTSFRPMPLFQTEYDRIDSEDDKKRCERYGFAPLGDKKRRRLFFGSMIADDSLEVVKAHAAEVFDVYHTVALVESNTTHNNKPRTMRFGNETGEGFELLKSGIFGPNSQVVLDKYLGDASGTIDMNRERIQREEIIKVWKRAGMRPEDVGIMADLDEVFTRDFLRAAQECDIPAFRADENCREPKVIASALIFESSPECCINRRWYHADMVIGHCIEQIGDPTGRIVAEREGVDGIGIRKKGFGGGGQDDYSDVMKKNGSYPLLSGTDMRELATSSPLRTIKKKSSDGFSDHTGYHLHNFFDDMRSLRQKYRTYAHSDPNAYRKKLSDLHKEDTDVMVRCAKGIPIDKAKYKDKKTLQVFKYHEGGLASFEGFKPIYFLNEDYRKKRHQQLKEVVKEDEAQYGTHYPDEQ